MSSSIKRKIYGYKSADTSCVFGAGMKYGADGKHVTKASAKSDKLMGVCQTEAGGVLAAEDPVEVARPGGGANVLLNGTVSAGDELAFDGTGFVVAGSGDFCCVRAEEAGVSGNIIAAVIGVGYIKP